MSDWEVLRASGESTSIRANESRIGCGNERL